jgi:hypothetical protein
VVLRALPGPSLKGTPMSDIQLNREDLDGLSPVEIVSAKRAGRLNALLGVPGAVFADPVMRRPDGREMAPEAADAIRQHLEREAAREASETHAEATRQLTRDDLDGMTHAEIVAAKQAGTLDALLGRTQ